MYRQADGLVLSIVLYKSLYLQGFFYNFGCYDPINKGSRQITKFHLLERYRSKMSKASTTIMDYITFLDD